MRTLVDLAMRKTGDERASALLRILREHQHEMSFDQYAEVTFELGKVYLEKGDYCAAHHCFKEAVEKEPARKVTVETIVYTCAKNEQDVAKRLTLQADLLKYIPVVTLYDDIVAESFQQQFPQIAETAWRLFRKHSHAPAEDILFQLEAESYGYQITLDDKVLVSCFKEVTLPRNERARQKFTALIKRRDASHIPETAEYFGYVLESLDALDYGTTDEEKLIKAELVLKYAIISNAVSLGRFCDADQSCHDKLECGLVIFALYSMMQRDFQYKQVIVNANKAYFVENPTTSVAGQIWGDLFGIPIPQLEGKTSEDKMLIALDELKRIAEQPVSVANKGYARMIEDYITKLTQVGQ